MIESAATIGVSLIGVAAVVWGFTRAREDTEMVLAKYEELLQKARDDAAAEAEANARVDAERATEAAGKAEKPPVS